MIQTQIDYNKELEWLTNPNWKPAQVTRLNNHFKVRDEMSNKQFDDYQAKLMGYKSHKDMVAYNYKKDKEYYLKYGDKVGGLI